MNFEKNFGFKHKSGILMHVASLPSPYGIGSFGRPAFDWIDFLDATGTKCWQVLPLNPTAYADSPYQCPSSFAGNPYFVDLELLQQAKLLKKSELAAAKHDTVKVDYGYIFETRFVLLRKAFKRFVADDSYTAFCEDNKDWLDDYALFMALKVHYGYQAWITWEPEHRVYKDAKKQAKKFKKETAFWKFVQYMFFKQWDAVLSYAHEKDITIVGDMPIYVAYDSVEVWKTPKNYLLGDDLYPESVAGCPPDGFSEDGQLWGNPIYNWAVMKKNKFDWWVQRVKQCFKMYDILRIDHFRGFAGYYSIPYGEPTARNGEWITGVGKDLFAEINRQVPEAKIIAEDLGYITPDVTELLEFCGYPGMKMLQEAYYDDDSVNLPRNYLSRNCVAYTGSHDGDCTTTWAANIKGVRKERFDRECRRLHASRTYDLIDFGFSSIANLAVVPMQDWLLLTNKEGRMNFPSVAEGNWSWRAPKNYGNVKMKETIHQMNIVTVRHKDLIVLE
jgi:4-alpha-glucanotransferase